MPISPFLDRNTKGTLLPSAVRAATNAAPDQVNANARGVIVYCSVTAVPGTDTVNFQLQLKSPVSGAYTTLISTGAKAATGEYLLIVYPNAVDPGSVFSGLAAMPLPRDWRVNVVHSAGSNFTYSVSAETLG